jgi:aspartyl-tRNA(Asn)/glutamyl-tRNA(Gln) amidotransferase subunit B
LKNLNSFQHAAAAIQYEVERQGQVLDRGGEVVQETRLWSPERGRTETMRGKEESQDYRYFPDPDLPVLRLPAAWREEERAAAADLPLERRRKFRELYGFAGQELAALTESRDEADYFEAVVAAGAPARDAANWLRTDVQRELNERRLSVAGCGLEAADLARIVAAEAQGRINRSIAREVLHAAMDAPGCVESLLAGAGTQVTDDQQLGKWVDAELAAQPGAVDKIRAGDWKPLGALVGGVMRRSGGKANAPRVQEMLRARLSAK